METEIIPNIHRSRFTLYLDARNRLRTDLRLETTLTEQVAELLEDAPDFAHETWSKFFNLGAGYGELYLMNREPAVNPIHETFDAAEFQNAFDTFLYLSPESDRHKEQLETALATFLGRDDTETPFFIDDPDLAMFLCFLDGATMVHAHYMRSVVAEPVQFALES